MGLLRIDRFAKGVLFAALAALVAVAGVVFAGPLVGAGPAIAGFFGALSLAWIFGAAPKASAGFLALLVAGPIVAFALLVWPAPTPMAVGVTALIGVARGVFLRRGPAARTVVVEGVVAVGSLGLASAFVPGGLTGLGLAVWSYFLVQSLPMLIAATREPAPSLEPDAFAAAMSRAEQVLGR